jgi:hypothetical protein
MLMLQASIATLMMNESLIPMSDFAAFILTHGRPDNVITYRTLRKQGYTGPIVVVIDNEDKQADKYRANFGEQVYMFDKKAVADTIDEGDNFNDRRAIIYARNACFDIAEELGYKYFIQLDDDYQGFRYKNTDNNELTSKKIKDLDLFFGNVLSYYLSTSALSISLFQGGDFIGGKDGAYASEIMIKRKAMNSFFCSTDRRFKFFGRINEDVNTYVTDGARGKLFYSIGIAAIQQKQTQSNSGGMTELYLDSGTYVKSFYSVMYSPSSVKVKIMQSKHGRLHHSVSWKNAVPCIVDERLRKVSPFANKAVVE